MSIKEYVDARLEDMQEDIDRLTRTVSSLQEVAADLRLSQAAIERKADQESVGRANIIAVTSLVLSAVSIIIRFVT